MFPNLVTYHIHRTEPLPPNDTLAYQYILAGNGLFVRAETRFFRVILPVGPAVVRGLPLLAAQFQLRVPRLTARLLETILADARRARRPDGSLNEVLYQFHHHGQTVQVTKPPQRATGVSVLAAGDNAPTVFCDLHSHGAMAAFFSAADNADEQGARLYAVIGKVDTTPEIRLRVGVYGYWQPLPVTAVFAGRGPYKDLYEEKPS